MPLFSLGLATTADAEQAAEAVWLGSLSMIERTVVAAREGMSGRWHSYPRGDLRRLRRDVAQAMTLALIAVQLMEQANGDEGGGDLPDDLQHQAASVAATRRAGTRARDAALQRNAELRASSDAVATVPGVTG